MPTEAKRDTVAELSEAFSASKGAIVSEYRGLTVPDLGKIRRELRDKGVSYTVVKNRLAKIAAEQAGRSEFMPLLSGPTAITLGGSRRGSARPRATLDALRPYSEDRRHPGWRHRRHDHRRGRGDPARDAAVRATCCWPSWPVASRRR